MDNLNGKTIGFIGLGQMGMRMAKNLRGKTEAKMLVHDANEGAVTTFLRENGGDRTWGGDLKRIREECDVVITMLPASEHAEAVYFVPGGLLAGGGAGKLFIDSSTISPAMSRRIGEGAAGHGSMAVDAPVSGGIGAAEAGTLTFMVGGPEAGFQAAHGILDMMGKNVVHCGEGWGSGQGAKLCNNMLLGVSMLGVAEAMSLGRKLGLDGKVLAGIINTSSGRCWSSEVYNPCPGVVEGAPSTNGYAGGFNIQLMAKDMRLALEAAEETRTTVPLSGLAKQVYKDVAGEAEYADKDFSVVYRWMEGEGGK